MAFHDIRLDDAVERGASGGPGFNTSVIGLSSGFEQRNMNWESARCKYDIGYGIQTKEDFSGVLQFFYARRGKGHSFRFKDWSDFAILDWQSIGTGDGADVTWQIFKDYSDSEGAYERTIFLPITGTVMVRVNNVVKVEGGGNDYTVNYDTGLITFVNGFIPGIGHDIEVMCEFDVPVRFDTDDLTIAMATFDAGDIPQINLVEVRGETA